MEPTDYLVCPKCGNPMFYVNGKWCCKVCGYCISSRYSLPLEKDKALYTSRTA